ncbi:MAG: hypothetical protein QOI66_888 [Myxococcales bacterium]|jgi:hypothetical protein|nr:hypothetical protein [Myxococcales bacterium]
MKVTGPGAGQSGGPADISGPQAPGQTGEKKGIAGSSDPAAAGPAGPGGLVKGGATAQTAAAASPQPGVVATHDIAAQLKTGALTPAAAMDRVIDRIVAQQLGAQAPPAVSESLKAALRDAVETDPMLAAKLRSLGGSETG